MKKEDLTRLVKNASDLKGKATRLAQDAGKKAGAVKQAVQTGVATSRVVLKSASHVINKDGIAQGIEVTSKGVEYAAKGARLASKGAETLASTMELAADGMKKITTKMKSRT